MRSQLRLRADECDCMLGSVCHRRNDDWTVKGVAARLQGAICRGTEHEDQITSSCFLTVRALRVENLPRGISVPIRAVGYGRTTDWRQPRADQTTSLDFATAEGWCAGMTSPRPGKALWPAARARTDFYELLNLPWISTRMASVTATRMGGETGRVHAQAMHFNLHLTDQDAADLASYLPVVRPDSVLTKSP